MSGRCGAEAGALQSLVILLMAGGLASRSASKGQGRLPDLYWNTTNSIFQISNTDHIIDVNKDSVGHQYDQINIYCPYYEATDRPRVAEKHIIYAVGREDYEMCRVSGENPRSIGHCTNPYKKMYYTISFRSFSPMPGSLEYLPGQDYYFISTSGNPAQHSGGYCKSHNMKVTFKVAPKRDESYTAAQVVQSPVQLLDQEEDASDRRGKYEVRRSGDSNESQNRPKVTKTGVSVNEERQKRRRPQLVPGSDLTQLTQLGHSSGLGSGCCRAGQGPVLLPLLLFLAVLNQCYTQ